MDYKIRTKIARILLEDAVELNSEITILGLVRSVRVSKEVAFIDVNDGSCMGNIQAVFSDPNNNPNINKVTTGSFGSHQR